MCLVPDPFVLKMWPIFELWSCCLSVTEAYLKHKKIFFRRISRSFKTPSTRWTTEACTPTPATVRPGSLISPRWLAGQDRAPSTLCRRQPCLHLELIPIDQQVSVICRNSCSASPTLIVRLLFGPFLKLETWNSALVPPDNKMIEHIFNVSQ